MKTGSTLEFALLGLLSQKPQSGYDLRKTFATTAMRHYSDSPGSIYPALRRLEGRGLIEADAPTNGLPKDPRKRQAYRLNAEGKAALVAWLEQPVSRENVTLQLAELMLRFAFMDGNVPRSSTLRFLDEFAPALAAHVAKLRADFERMRMLVSAHTGLLAFQCGIEGMEAQLAWARQARARLAEDSK